jgi:hypothetical protein
MAELTKQEVLNNALTGYRDSLPLVFVNYNKITEEDLKQLKTVQKQKIVLTKPFAEYKVGDILEVKFISNTQASEPPRFLVIDEKLGSTKYGFGGYGSTPFYELFKEKENSSENLSPSVKNISTEEKFYESLGIKSKGGWSPTAKAKGRFYLAVVLIASYFAYKKFKK